MHFAITNSPDHSTLQLHLNNQYINVIALKLELIKKKCNFQQLLPHTPRHFPWLFLSWDLQPKSKANLQLYHWNLRNEVNYRPMRASEPRPAPDPMKRRRFRTQGMEEAGGIFFCAAAAAAASWPSPSLDPLYIVWSPRFGWSFYLRDRCCDWRISNRGFWKEKP